MEAFDWIDWKRNGEGREAAAARARAAVAGIFIACTRPRTRGQHIPGDSTFLQRNFH